MTIAKSDLAIAEISPAPDGKQVAFLTEPIHKRIENPADYEILIASEDGGAPKPVTHNAAMESNLRWSRDGRWLHFSVNAANGSIDGKYRDMQGRLFRLDPTSGKIERLRGLRGIARSIHASCGRPRIGSGPERH